MAHRSYVDATAGKQLKAVTALLDMRNAVGIPDLHPGSRFGCAVAADGVYTALVGSVSFYFLAPRRTTMPARLAARLVSHNAPSAGDRRAWLARYCVADPSIPDPDLGTVDAGNHLAELCDVKAVLPPMPAHVALAEGALFLLVHCVSRGLESSGHIRRADPRGRRETMSGAWLAVARCVPCAA